MVKSSTTKKKKTKTVAKKNIDTVKIEEPALSPDVVDAIREVEFENIRKEMKDKEDNLASSIRDGKLLLLDIQERVDIMSRNTRKFDKMEFMFLGSALGTLIIMLLLQIKVTMF